MEDISDETDFDNLPETVKSYIARVEELLGIPITYVSVGPEREALLTRTAAITA
jgi:adenylosuccinate synthase